MPNLNIGIHEDLMDRLRAMSKREGRTQRFIVTQLIRHAVEASEREEQRESARDALGSVADQLRAVHKREGGQ